MRKGRLDRQAGSKGRGLDFGIETFRPLRAEGDKGSQCDTMKSTFGELSLAAVRRTPCRRA